MILSSVKEFIEPQENTFDHYKTPSRNNYFDLKNKIKKTTIEI